MLNGASPKPDLAGYAGSPMVGALPEGFQSFQKYRLSFPLPGPDP